MLATLLVPKFAGRSQPVEGQDLQLPLNGNRRLKFSHDRDAIGSELTLFPDAIGTQSEIRADPTPRTFPAVVS